MKVQRSGSLSTATPVAASTAKLTTLVRNAPNEQVAGTGARRNTRSPSSTRLVVPRRLGIELASGEMSVIGPPGVTDLPTYDTGVR